LEAKSVNWILANQKRALGITATTKAHFHSPVALLVTTSFITPFAMPKKVGTKKEKAENND
jgi:hypothetical protein